MQEHEEQFQDEGRAEMFGAEKMQFCPKCGKDNWDTARLRCLNCGYKMKKHYIYSPLWVKRGDKCNSPKKRKN